jgi:intracellular septation protein A
MTLSLTSDQTVPAPSATGGLRSRLGVVARIVRPLAMDLAGSLFFGALYVATHDLVLATLAGVAMGVAAIAWKLARREPVAALQWASAGLVLAMGGLAVATHDPRIVMIKPTLAYVVVGGAMLQRGWMLRYAVPHRLIPPAAFVVAGYGWAALLLLSAALNLYVALVLGPKTWALFLAVFPITAKLGGFAVQTLGFAVVAAVNRRRQRARAAVALPAAA